MGIMFCSQCGTAQAANSKFCVSCGYSHSGNVSSSSLTRTAKPVQIGDNRKSPCNCCGSTQYNKVRKCVDNARQRTLVGSGCGKLGCDFCFKRYGAGQDYVCPQCTMKKNIFLIITLPIISVFAYLLVFGFIV